jgi:DNA repair protein SbcD/Mre11
VPKLVHAADLHLDSPLVGLERYEAAPVAELRRATRDALDRLVELCLSERADLLLVAGDLFDGTWRDYSTGLFLCERMARLREAGVAVVWLRGNHDAASRLTQHLRMPENVRELSSHEPESVAFDRLNLVVHGQGFARAAVETDLSARYPAAVAGALNVGLLHTALEGREGHAPYAPCRLSALVDRGYDYWALGHVHAHELVHRDPWVVYPGNLQGRYARETGPKGAMLVEFDGARIRQVEHRALDVVRWARVSVDASTCSTLDDVAEAARDALATEVQAAGQRLLAVRVEVRGRSRAHGALQSDRERALASVRAAGLDVPGGSIWIERVELGTRPPGDPLDRAAQERGPLADLLREVDALRQEPEALASFLSEMPGLAELTRKLRLPQQPGEGDELLPAALLEDALELLLARLGDADAP